MCHAGLVTGGVMLWVMECYTWPSGLHMIVVTALQYTSGNFFFHWRYSLLWALACRTMPLHFSLSMTNSLHLLTPSTWRSLSTFKFNLSTSSVHHLLGLLLRLVPSSSWVKIFLGILFSSILSRWPSQLILCPFIHFTIFSRLLNSSSSQFVLLFHSPFS